MSTGLPPRLTRRRLLQLVCAQAGLALAAGCGDDDGGGGGGPNTTPPQCDSSAAGPAPTTLQALLDAVGAVAASLLVASSLPEITPVRDAWLADTGEEEAAVLAALAPAWPLLHVPLGADPACANAQVRAAVLEELRTLTTVDVEGWTLAPTELRVAAIATLWAERAPAAEDA